MNKYTVDPLAKNGLKPNLCRSGIAARPPFHSHPNVYKYSQMSPVYNTHNRLLYDKCAYEHRLYESTSPLAYNINPIAYESCSKCQMMYPGFLGTMGGFGFGVGPNEIDLESDLRNQTRVNTLCPSYKYMPKCGCKQSGIYCKGCQQGLPCGCKDCRYTNVNNVAPCRPGIIPVESLDSRQIKPCNDLSEAHINRFDYLCENPQDPSRVFFYTDNQRLGVNTNLNERDRHEVDYKSGCLNVGLNNALPCKAGGLGCKPLSSFGNGIMLRRGNYGA